ncbi:MAG TPA: alkaline phosphatase family protein [Candidatus Methylomirabilis sp.]|nr:alkaline phosphatase family protein [Candidatus Methylomirabilis sp.]
MRKTAALVCLVAACSIGTTIAEVKSAQPNPIQRVLLISIDGMHAVDFLNCANGISTTNNNQPYCPTIAALGQTGINYVAASTSKPSDSFPGLTAIVTGGSPALTGVYYDVAYSRNYSAPAKTTGNGVAAGPCTPYGPPTGTTTEYEEGIDINQHKLNGGAPPPASLTDGGLASIDHKRLPRDPEKGCAPVMPWEFVRANSIFSVIHSMGGYAAWSDKHPAYASVASGIGPSALDDFYAPEINSNVIGLPGVKTPTGISCAKIRDKGADLTAWTNSFENIQCYDTLKVDAILNEINGKDHLGTKTTQVPTIFGMNFQAVSVGQKLIENGVKGGYLDAAGTPSSWLLNEIQFVDASIAAWVNELKAKGLYDSTLIVITAKHGQSPIDPSRYVGQTINGTSPATLLSNDGYLPYSESTNNPTGIGPTEDDVSLLWLSSSFDTDAAVAVLEANASATTGIALGQIYYGPSLFLNYNDPTTDPRTPDIIVTPNVGVTYSGSHAKQAEHGGFSHDDTNVVLLLSNPNFKARTVSAGVGTAQVAPTILKALGIKPGALDAVRAEGTAVLPAIPF